MNGTFLSNIDGKNAILKKHMIALCINEGDYSIADLSKELNTSIPTITKLVGELIEEGFLVDMGKQDAGRASTASTLPQATLSEPKSAARASV